MTEKHSTRMQVLPHAEAKALLDREPVKNARALLRYALPIENKPVRQMQVNAKPSRLESAYQIRLRFHY